jgi:hypothetical protein
MDRKWIGSEKDLHWIHLAVVGSCEHSNELCVP